MAEALGVASSLIAIASAGIAVVSSLTKFGISFKGSSEKINSLAGRVSLTASILSDIASTVEENASGFRKDEFRRTWGKVLRSCEGTYKSLEKALLKAKKGRSVISKDGKLEVSVWSKLVWALGGEGQMKDLEKELESCCQQVMMMQQAVQMSVLNLVAKRQILSTEQKDEQADLIGKLQWLITNLAASGILPGPTQSGKTVIIIDDDKPLASQEPATASRGPPDLNSPREIFGSFMVQGVQPLKSVRFATDSPIPAFKKIPPIIPEPPRKTDPKKKKDQPLDAGELFFEAYYIVPRSIPRIQEKGEVQITKPTTDDYMIICVDIKRDYRNDGNLRQVVRKAKRAQDITSFVTFDGFPRIIQEIGAWLAHHRRKHSGEVAWSLAAGTELRYTQESHFRKSLSASAYILVLRGTVIQPKIEDWWTPREKNILPVTAKHERSLSTGQRALPLPSSLKSKPLTAETLRPEKKYQAFAESVDESEGDPLLEKLRATRVNPAPSTRTAKSGSKDEDSNRRSPVPPPQVPNDASNDEQMARIKSAEELLRTRNLYFSSPTKSMKSPEDDRTSQQKRLEEEKLAKEMLENLKAKSPSSTKPNPSEEKSSKERRFEQRRREETEREERRLREINLEQEKRKADELIEKRKWESNLRRSSTFSSSKTKGSSPERVPSLSTTKKPASTRPITSQTYAYSPTPYSPYATNPIFAGSQSTSPTTPNIVYAPLRAAPPLTRTSQSQAQTPYTRPLSEDITGKANQSNPRPGSRGASRHRNTSIPPRPHTSDGNPPLSMEKSSAPGPPPPPPGSFSRSSSIPTPSSSKPSRTKSSSTSRSHPRPPSKDVPKPIIIVDERPIQRSRSETLQIPDSVVSMRRRMNISGPVSSEDISDDDDDDGSIDSEEEGTSSSDPTLVGEGRGTGDVEEIHISRKEAVDLLGRFLESFTVV